MNASRGARGGLSGSKMGPVASLLTRCITSNYLLAAGVLCFIWNMAHMHHLASLSLASCDDREDVITPQSVSSLRSLPQVVNKESVSTEPAVVEESSCMKEYNRLTEGRTPGITKMDLLRSQAWIGNQNRLNKAMDTLKERKRPAVAVVAGGSISLGHGVEHPYRYGERLENWMNDKFPLDDSKHQVINVAAHGADMCSMAKRLNVLFSDLESRMPKSSNNEPDLIILEFAVNDYQGQDHTVHIDHKMTVFYDGFQNLVLCAEVVVYSLLTKFPNAAVVFLEMQTANFRRKTGALLHMGIAQQYQIPVISYAEAMFHDYYRLMKRLGEMDEHTYSFPDSMWMEDGGLGIDPAKVSNETPIASAIFPFPHGCARCRQHHIEPQFRKGYCKSICRFLKHGNLLPEGGSGLTCNDSDGPFPKGRNECFVPFFAHDEVHPSAVGHAIAMDFIVDTLVSAQFRTCEHNLPPEENFLPLTTFVASSFEELKDRGDFMWVHDVDRIFARWDELKPVPGDDKKSAGFTRYADDPLKQRPGWVATNEKGGEFITFPIDLPPGQCYTVYVAILKSYNGMGTMQIEVTDFGSKKGDSSAGRQTTQKQVDGLWDSPISVWNDVQISGKCAVTNATRWSLEAITLTVLNCLLQFYRRQCARMHRLLRGQDHDRPSNSG